AEYVKLGLLTEAIENAEKATQVDANFVDARLWLGGLYSSLKIYPSAIAQYEQVLKIEPGNLEAPLYLGAVWAERGEFEKAISFFDKLLRSPQYTTPHLAHYYVGRVYMEQKGPQA